MRVSYIPPGVLDFDRIFSPQNLRGGGLSDINVVKPYYYHNRGGSLFGILGNIIRRTIPFLTSYVLPEAGNFARNMADDYGRIPLKKNVKRNLIKSMKNIGKRVMTGGSKVKKNIKRLAVGGVVKKKQILKNKKDSHCKDIFGHMNS